MLKNLKTALFQTFSTWHPNTFCPYCLISTSINLYCCCLGIRDFCAVYPGSCILYIISYDYVLHSSHLKAPPNVPLSHLCSAFSEGRPSLCFQLFFVSALALGSLWAHHLLGCWPSSNLFQDQVDWLGNQTIKNGPGWPEVVVFSLGACRPLFKSEISKLLITNNVLQH